MTAFVVGTAGHIDHGKTSLVRALTGVDCDRLEEEKRRGITIELGFAPLVLPSGTAGGVVDVPGHEGLVRTMIAGATGIDLALLVVAADEGVMPQTREHLDILRILRVPRLLVALTKTDLVDEDLAALAAEEVAAELSPTPYAGSPVLAVSSASGAGIDALKAALDAAVAGLPARSRGGPFRLPVDRSFSKRGFGTVVTGTCVSGAVSVGQEVDVLPAGHRARVRGVQVHGRGVQEAGPSSRVALNLQGLGTEEVSRGSLVATPDSVPVTTMVDVRLLVLESAGAPLRTRCRVRFLAGTAETLGVVQFIGDAAAPDPGEVDPGWSGLAQVRLDAPLPLRRGDRFVFRRSSPMVTLGGGHVLDPLPHRYRRREGEAHRRFLTVLDADPRPEEAALALLEREAPQPLDSALAARRLSLAREEARSAFDASVAAGHALAVEGGRYAHAGVLAGYRKRVLAELRAFHAAEPLLAGIPWHHLRTRLPGALDARFFATLVGALEAEGAVEADDLSVRLPGYAPRLEGGQRETADRLDRLYLEAGLEPPDPAAAAEALSGRTDVPALLGWLQRTGRLLRIKEDILLHRDAWEGLVERVRAHLAGGGEMDPVAFKELTGLSRRLAIPMLEYLDRQRVTVRVGNVRRWRGEHGR